MIATDVEKVPWQRLAEDNMRLAHMIVRKAFDACPSIRHVGYDDAIGASYLALTKAARSYDPAYGVRFSTYACIAMWHAVFAAARHAGPVSVPGWLFRPCADGHPYRQAAARASRRAASVDSLVEAGLFSEEGDDAGGHGLPDVVGLLDRLPRKFAHAVRRVVVDGAAYATVAGELKINKSLVRWYVGAGLRRLRQLIEGQDKEAA